MGECLLLNLQSLKRIEMSLIFFRAIHTNYEAKFMCGFIKMAVIKNRWFAEGLEADMYSVVFKYGQGNMNSAYNEGGLLCGIYV